MLYPGVLDNVGLSKDVILIILLVEFEVPETTDVTQLFAPHTNPSIQFTSLVVCLTILSF